MKRGDLVTVAVSGDYGKPRPALIVQSDFFTAHPSVTLLPVTSELRDALFFRIRIEPSAETGLRLPSDIMIDKMQTVPRAKIGKVIGKLDDSTVVAVNRALALFLGFA